MDTGPYEILYTSTVPPQARTGSCGSDTLSDDDLSQFVSHDNSPKRKAATKKKLKPGEQPKPQNRGRKPGQSKPCVDLRAVVELGNIDLVQ